MPQLHVAPQATDYNVKTDGNELHSAERELLENEPDAVLRQLIYIFRKEVSGLYRIEMQKLLWNNDTKLYDNQRLRRL